MTPAIREDLADVLAQTMAIRAEAERLGVEPREVGLRIQNDLLAYRRTLSDVHGYELVKYELVEKLKEKAIELAKALT